MWYLLFTAIRMSHTAACESQSIEFTELWQASFKKLLSSMPVVLRLRTPSGTAIESAYQEFDINPQNMLIGYSSFGRRCLRYRVHIGSV